MEVICSDGKPADLRVITGLSQDFDKVRFAVNMLLPDGGPKPNVLPNRVETAGPGRLTLGHDVDFVRMQEVVELVCGDAVEIVPIS